MNKERLGLAWCRLNRHEWDGLIGEEPKSEQEREKAIIKAMKAIESILGKAECSRYWWKFELGKSYAEWFDWYVKQ